MIKKKGQAPTKFNLHIAWIYIFNVHPFITIDLHFVNIAHYIIFSNNILRACTNIIYHGKPQTSLLFL